MQIPAMQAEPRLRRLPRLRFLIAGGALSFLLLAGALVVISELPFRRGTVIKQVEIQTGARVEIRNFHQTWFPPGFAAEGARLSDREGNVLTLDEVAIEGTYLWILHSPKLLAKVHGRGLRLAIRPQKEGRQTLPLLNGTGSPSGLAVRELRLDNAFLDFVPEDPAKPALEFVIHALILNDLGQGKQTQFQVSLHNPMPSGEVHSHGSFGPVDRKDPGRTPVSGTFTYEHADLTVQHGITGTLDASGSFRGPLRRLECTGTADVPQFQVFGSTHPTHISSRFDAAVDAQTGDTVLERVVAHFNSTTVSATGKVAHEPDRPGKIVTVDTNVRNGRVEDLLLLFTDRPLPAMHGPIALQAKFTIPPGPLPFLTKLQVDGQFSITHAHFTNPKTQTPIDRLSASAAGESKHQQREHPELAPADITGHVTDRGGLAKLAPITVEVPGIRSRLSGVFELQAKRIDLKGVFETRGKLPDTTSGMKALALKVMGPLWPRRASVQTVPFHITGTTAHPVFRLELHQ